ncbi:MAG TPA: 23S rRNA (adenine(2503)-C(2))-methyltransferase RlmN, partial [Candidatus Hydrogenedentes bacterium]|nr:23S rRNA (adenine(2503)-C(2))-methyltransferase RlmN [Candidatus Hydrogenedentota bacterium]
MRKLSTVSINTLTGMFPEEISEALEVPVMRGKQLFQWLQKKQVMYLDAMTDLPETLRET